MIININKITSMDFANVDTKINEELDTAGCFKLVRAVIENCLMDMSLSSEPDDVVIERRIEFAKYAPLLQIFADCSDMLNEDVLRKRIIDFNEELRFKSLSRRW